MIRGCQGKAHVRRRAVLCRGVLKLGAPRTARVPGQGRSSASCWHQTLVEGTRFIGPAAWEGGGKEVPAAL